MDRSNPFFKQVELLIAALPLVAKQECFALKGGTAINLFVRDLPRLSVDIDLAYLPLKDRDTSLAEIDSALKSIAADIEKKLSSQVTRAVLKGTGKVIKLIVTRNGSIIKIEISPVLRGSVFESRLKNISLRAEEYFGYVEAPILSYDDLYAGKLCAALDRQHPRDIFDIKLLLEDTGITESLKNAFLVYLIGHSRPMAELLEPNFIDLQDSFTAEFEGMTFESVSLKELEETRVRLVEEIRKALDDKDKNFLLSVKKGEPEWNLLSIEHARELPSVKWKLYNISRMNKDKGQEAYEKLRDILWR